MGVQTNSQSTEGGSTGTGMTGAAVGSPTAGGGGDDSTVVGTSQWRVAIGVGKALVVAVAGGRLEAGVIGSDGDEECGAQPLREDIRDRCAPIAGGDASVEVEAEGLSVEATGGGAGQVGRGEGNPRAPIDLVAARVDQVGQVSRQWLGLAEMTTRV